MLDFFFEFLLFDSDVHDKMAKKKIVQQVLKRLM